MRLASPIQLASALALAAEQRELVCLCSTLAPAGGGANKRATTTTPTTPTSASPPPHRPQQQKQQKQQQQRPPRSPACARLHTLARPSLAPSFAAAAAAASTSGSSSWAAAARSASAAAAAADASTSSSSSPSRAREAQRQRERLDVKIDAQVTFDACWRRFEARHPDFARSARVPREVIFLQGAPASGKGTHTPAIVEARALARVVSVSGVLKAFPEARALMDGGAMVDDALVADALLEALLAPPTPQQAEAIAAPVAAACPEAGPPASASSSSSSPDSAHALSPPPPAAPSAAAAAPSAAAAVLAPAPGVLVDGFPRTTLQVDFLKLLHERLLSLHDAAAEAAAVAEEQGGGGSGNGSNGSNGSNGLAAAQEAAARFPRVAFRVVALFVDEATSLARQQGRAHRTAQHNLRVLDAASVVGPPPPPSAVAAARAAFAASADDDAPDLGLDLPRATDADLARAKQRYSVFRAHYPALLRLRAFLPFHLVDASGEEDDVRDAVLSELRYQSSVELSAGAYAVVRSLPLASDLQAAARQALVSRLDGYAAQRPGLLAEVAALLRREAVPVLTRAGLVGRAEWTTRAGLFEGGVVADEQQQQHNGGACSSSSSSPSSPLPPSANGGAFSSISSSPPVAPVSPAVDMVVDLLADRGFQASHAREEQLVPTRFDPATGHVLDYAPRLICHRFSITFDAPGVRQLRAMETAARVAETAGGGAASAFAAAVARRPSPAALGDAVERVHQRLAERERERREAHARALREVEMRQQKEEEEQEQEEHQQEQREQQQQQQQQHAASA